VRYFRCQRCGGKGRRQTHAHARRAGVRGSARALTSAGEVLLPSQLLEFLRGRSGRWEREGDASGRLWRGGAGDVRAAAPRAQTDCHGRAVAQMFADIQQLVSLRQTTEVCRAVRRCRWPAAWHLPRASTPAARVLAR